MRVRRDERERTRYNVGMVHEPDEEMPTLEDEGVTVKSNCGDLAATGANWPLLKPLSNPR